MITSDRYKRLFELMLGTSGTLILTRVSDITFTSLLLGTPQAVAVRRCLMPVSPLGPPSSSTFGSLPSFIIAIVIVVRDL